MIEDPEFDSRQEQGILLFTASRLALVRTDSRIEWVPEAVSPGIKRPGPNANRSLTSSVEVKNAWSCASAPPYIFIAWCLGTGTTLPLPPYE
jgi:hypothetical protein